MAENKHQLKRHVRWEHHGGKREECPKCSFVATKTQKLWPHWRTHHPNEEVLHCDMCGYVTPLEYLMEVSTIRIGCAFSKADDRTDRLHECDSDMDGGVQNP